MKRIALLLGVVLLSAVVGLAQQPDAPDEADENGFLLGLLQNTLSAPGREVRIIGISGVLSSQASIAEITVSDADGIWLRIENAVIDWSRAALLLRRVNISSLSADAIDYIRPPLPPERTGPTRADAEARPPFALPELPVEVRLEALRIDRLSFGEAVFGQAADLSVTGGLELVAGEIDTELAIRRLDGPGGALELRVEFSNVTRLLDLDLQLDEPQGGIVATALNIEGRPPIALALQGAGPLEDVDLDFSLDAAGTRLAAGEVLLRSTDDGLGFLADFAGELAPLVPPAYRDFFAGRTTVRVDGLNKAVGGVRIDDLAIAGAALALDGRLETGADGFLRSLNLTGELGDPRGDGVTLPLPGARTRMHSAVLHVVYGDASRWTGLLALDRLVAGDLEIEDLTLSMGGLAQHLEDPARRNVTINLEGLATGLWTADPDVRAGLGDRIDFFADAALPPAGPVVINQLQLSSNFLSIFSAGTVADYVYSGRHAVRAVDISPFSGLAGRMLAGGIDVRAVGDVMLTSGGFDLVLDGLATDLEIDDARADALLAGETALSGRLGRDETGFRADAFRIAGDQLEFTATGLVSTSATDIGFDARLADLALIVPEVSGAVTASGRAAGLEGPVAVTLEAAIPEGEVGGRSLTGALVAFDGEVLNGSITGALRGTGRLDAAEIALAGDIGLVGETRTVEDLVLEVGPNRLTGTLVQAGEAPVEGALTLRAPDLEPLAALALIEVTGSANAEITLAAAAIGQGVGIVADLRELAIAETRIGALDLEAEIVDALGVPLGQGTLAARDLLVAGIAMTRLDAEAEQTAATTMRFAAETTLAIGTEAALAGELERLPGGFSLGLERLTLAQNGIAARLLAPATATIVGDEITLTPLALALGEGRLEASGRIADEIDVALMIDALPLALANTVQPELGLTGTVDGSARVTGPRDAPQISFDLTAAGVSAAFLEAAGLPPMAVEARGDTEGTLLNFDARMFSTAAGIEARAVGRYRTDTGDLDFDLDLGALPLDLIDDFTGQQGLDGTLTGTVRVTGAPAAPEAAFALAGTGVSARVLRDNLVPPLAVSAAGTFVDRTVTLTSASVSGPGDIALAASGTVPLEGPGLAVNVAGGLPLSLANAALADRAAQVAGTVQLDVAVRGTLAEPQPTGPVAITGATFVDPGTNIRLEDIFVDAVLEGDAVNLRVFRARGAQGGTIGGSGRIGLAAGFPADLQVALDDLRYSDGTFVSTRFTGALALTGPLIGDGGRLSGEIDLGPTEISVAEGLGINARATLEQVSHRNAPAVVRRTLDRARVGADATPLATGRAGLEVDVLIRAPNQIFVRGRGLDAELGGELRVRGPTTDLEPVGEFTLRRGRIAILGQRVLFDEGRLQLIGSLDPEIFFSARTVTDGTTAIVTVSGRASSPDITFSSVPELPEDEVLSRILFNRSSQQLSPFQLAQLAVAAAELAGAGGNGLLSQLRSATRLDELDIITEESGEAALRAGRYLDDNLYLDVQTSTEGETRAGISLDITDRITARGSVGSDGNSTLGIFFQRDF